MSNPIIKVKRGGYSSISSITPQQAEFIYDTTNNKLYIGNGEDPVEDLTPCGGSHSHVYGVPYTRWERYETIAVPARSSTTSVVQWFAIPWSDLDADYANNTNGRVIGAYLKLLHKGDSSVSAIPFSAIGLIDDDEWDGTGTPSSWLRLLLLGASSSKNGNHFEAAVPIYRGTNDLNISYVVCEHRATLAEQITVHPIVVYGNSYFNFETEGNS